MIWLVSIIFGTICAAIAEYKGRSVVGWFFLGFLFGIFALIVLLITSNLKAAEAKEQHVEMEQKRLREQLRQEQIKTEQLRKYTQVRLDLHDRKLDIDTRHIGHLLKQAGEQPLLDSRRVLGERMIDAGPVKRKRIITQCPYCYAKFRVPYEEKGRKAKCSKCNGRFVVGHFVENKEVKEHRSYSRKVIEVEKAPACNNRAIPRRRDERIMSVSNYPQMKQESRYYQEGWYHKGQYCAVGPLSLENVKRLFREGKIHPSTSIWHESLYGWTPAGKVGQLNAEVGHG